MLTRDASSLGFPLPIRISVRKRSIIATKHSITRQLVASSQECYLWLSYFYSLNKKKNTNFIAINCRLFLLIQRFQYICIFYLFNFFFLLQFKEYESRRRRVKSRNWNVHEIILVACNECFFLHVCMCVNICIRGVTK